MGKAYGRPPGQYKNDILLCTVILRVFNKIRHVDMLALECVFFDFGCGLDTYVLKREPGGFQYLRCLVDGSHWKGQMKLKRHNSSGRGGHLGCSEGFNCNMSKPFLPEVVSYSQGRGESKPTLRLRSVWAV